MFKSIYFSLKSNNKKYVVIVNCGKFYRSFGDDALVIHEIFKYKIHDMIVGFPDNSLESVILGLNNSGICVLVSYPKNNIVYYKVDINNYNRYLSMAKLFYDIEYKEDLLNNLVHKCLVKDINNYSKIKDFINEL